MSYYNTDPNNPRSVQTKRTGWRFQEAVVSELANLGVPNRIAELSVIDFRTALYISLKNKLTPFSTASIMMDIIKGVYQTDGKWHTS